ncbi:hypothetical protein TIFTF001_009693 [Ficus carica]|uniref:Uncharacterized protein n=1 Tax=Ficus carica TaxID=3494 RepID=A0AA87ZV38_FICCA|nr:hypothetical protein TIFTF001_009693 [Ficus carica]
MGVADKELCDVSTRVGKCMRGRYKSSRPRKARPACDALNVAATPNAAPDSTALNSLLFYLGNDDQS